MGFFGELTEQWAVTSCLLIFNVHKILWDGPRQEMKHFSRKFRSYPDPTKSWFLVEVSGAGVPQDKLVGLSPCQRVTTD